MKHHKAVKIAYFAIGLLKRMHRHTLHTALMSWCISLDCCPDSCRCSTPVQTLHINTQHAYISIHRHPITCRILNTCTHCTALCTSCTTLSVVSIVCEACITYGFVPFHVTCLRLLLFTILITTDVQKLYCKALYDAIQSGTQVG